MSRKKNKERIPLTKDFFNYSQSNIYNTINYNIGGVFNVSNNAPTTIFSSQRNDLHELQEKYFSNESMIHNSQVLKDEHSDNRFKDNEEINLNSASKDRFIYIKTKDNSNIEVNLVLVANYSIFELKKFVFPKLSEEKNIRLIYNGRLLNDNESILNLNFDTGAFVHAFISDKVEKRERTITNVSNNDVMNNANAVRGFERLKDLGIPQEDIILQKFAFHSHYVVIQKDPQIEFNNLINREEEWYAMNIEKLANTETNVTWFKNYDFYEEADPERIKVNYRCFWLFLAILIGFFANIAILPILFARKVSVQIKESLLIGLILKMFYICIVYLLIKELKFII